MSTKEISVLDFLSTPEGKRMSDLLKDMYKNYPTTFSEEKSAEIVKGEKILAYIHGWLDHRDNKEMVEYING